MRIRMHMRELWMGCVWVWACPLKTNIIHWWHFRRRYHLKKKTAFNCKFVVRAPWANSLQLVMDKILFVESLVEAITKIDRMWESTMLCVEEERLPLILFLGAGPSVHMAGTIPCHQSRWAHTMMLPEPWGERSQARERCFSWRRKAMYYGISGNIWRESVLYFLVFVTSKIMLCN